MRAFPLGPVDLPPVWLAAVEECWSPAQAMRQVVPELQLLSRLRPQPLRRLSSPLLLPLPSSTSHEPPQYPEVS